MHCLLRKGLMGFDHIYNWILGVQNLDLGVQSLDLGIQSQDRLRTFLADVIEQNLDLGVQSGQILYFG